MTSGRITRAAASLARVRVSEDFDFQWVLAFLRPRAIDGVESVSENAYVRSIHIGDHVGCIRLTAGARHIHAETEPGADAARTRALVRRMFDVNADVTAFRAHAAGDGVLGPLVARRPAIRLIRFADPFEGLVRAILGQQVSLAAAGTAAARLARLLGSPAGAPDGVVSRTFPRASALASVSERTLRETGLTGAKARALQAAARAVDKGAIDLEALARVPAAEADTALRSLPGVGPWTAAYVRMRALGDGDAFPASDLGVLKALRRLLRRPELTADDAQACAEAWRPWRAYATLHLWHSLADPA